MGHPGQEENYYYVLWRILRTMEIRYIKTQVYPQNRYAIALYRKKIIQFFPVEAKFPITVT